MDFPCRNEACDITAGQGGVRSLKSSKPACGSKHAATIEVGPFHPSKTACRGPSGPNRSIQPPATRASQSPKLAAWEPSHAFACWKPLSGALQARRAHACRHRRDAYRPRRGREVLLRAHDRHRSAAHGSDPPPSPPPHRRNRTQSRDAAQTPAPTASPRRRAG